MATRIYTRTGDRGTTALFGGQRVPKYDLRIETYGTVDELASIIGIVRSHSETPADVCSVLDELAALLFVLGSDLATPLEPPPKYPIPRIGKAHVEWLERCIDRWEEELPPLTNFILPGGTLPAAFLHLARTVCRRAERRAVELAEREPIGEFVVPFLNRCSDLLFVAARMVNYRCGAAEIEWKPPAQA